MKFEFRKLLSDRRILALLLAVLMINGILFYWYTSNPFDGATMQQIQEQYERNIDLSTREQVLWDMIQVPEQLGAPAYTAAMQEYMQVEAANKRIQEQESYEEIRANLVSQALIKITLGLFGDENSFSVRSLRQGAANYQALEGVTPEIGFFGSVELLTTWHLTDALFILFAIIPALVLFSSERGSGLQALTQPTKYGRFPLYAQKYGVCATLTLVGTLLLYGSNYLIVRQMFGPISFSAPVQSVYGYSACPERICVGEFLLMLFGQKLLWALSCLSVIVVCSACTGSSTLATGITAGGLLIAWAMSQSDLLWIRWLSFVRLAAGEVLFQSALYLNFFGYPLRLLPTCLTVLAIVVLIGFSVGAIIYCRKEIVGSRSNSFSRHRFLHTNLMLHEAEKSVFLWRGLVLLLVLAALQWGTYHNISAARGTNELYYRHYSEQLSGLPSAEKEAYISEQAAIFDEIAAKLDVFAEKYGKDSAEYSAALDRASDLLIAKEGFLQAKDQYQSLSPGQSYLYDTPYTTLLGPERKADDAVNYGKAFFIMALLFASSFSGEQETGMAVLQTSAGKKKAIFRRKMILLVTYCFLISLLAFLPRIWVVFATFGGLDLSAWANSTSWWQDLPNGMTVAGAFTLQLLKNFLVCVGAGGLVCFLSSRISNTVITIVVALACLLISNGIIYLLR